MCLFEKGGGLLCFLMCFMLNIIAGFQESFQWEDRKTILFINLTKISANSFINARKVMQARHMKTDRDCIVSLCPPPLMQLCPKGTHSIQQRVADQEALEGKGEVFLAF